MKLIPPQTTAPVSNKTVELGGTGKMVAPKRWEEPADKIKALETLTQIGDAFSVTLEQVVKRISKQGSVTPALALAALLTGTTEMLLTMLENFDAKRGDTDDDDGHAGRDSDSGGERTSTRGDRARELASGALSRKKSGDSRGDAGSDAPAAPKRGRGRPPGSKNKRTIEREIARASARTGEKAAVRRKLSVPVVKRSAAKPAARPAGKGGSKGGRKGASKKTGRQR